VDEEFSGFKRKKIKDLFFVGMTEYEDNYPKMTAFPQEVVTEPVGKILSDHNLTQLRIAESEKFPHVTYFFDGENDEIYPGEDRIEVPSPKNVATYDQQPEMSAKMLTDIVLEKIDDDVYDFILINFANGDMVAHTGILDAAIKAMETVDQCIGRIVAKVLDKNGAVILTADHGNLEEMIHKKTGGIDTEHSTNPVPFVVIKENEIARELTVGILADVAPTLLSILGIEKPTDMTGRNLLV
jgi:2,3-bisphosphoglycerate-independent phosphoglycerate mutase